jgi:hypothetical protein
MTFQSSTKLSYPLFFIFHVVTIVFHFYLYLFYVSCVVFSTFLKGLLILYFIYVFFLQPFMRCCWCISKQCYCNLHACALRLFNPFFPSFFMSLNFFISISCLLMAYGDEPPLKKHCVDVSKYSTNVFSYSLPTLFCLVITNNE